MTRYTVAGLIVGLAASLVSVVDAQTVPRRFAEPSPSSGVFTGAVMHMAIEPLLPRDTDFQWNAEFGGNVDLADYGRGRVNVRAHYQAVLGRRLQRFDPNQGNYGLEALASWRQGRGEWFAGIEHVSRHLGDRPKPFQINWNSLAGRYFTRRRVRGWQLDLHGGGGWVVSRRFLDYRAMLDGDVQVAQVSAGRAHPFGRLAVKRVWVEPGRAPRSHLGWRLEAGLRVSGGGARGELYLGAEQRFDADVFAPARHRWVVAGLRVSSP